MTSKRLLLVSLALAGFVLVGGAAAASGALYVTVDNSEGDVPSGDIVLTDADADGEVVKETNIGDGAFEFSGIDDGNYSLAVESYSHASSTHDLEVTDGDVFVDDGTTAQSSVDVTLSDGSNVTTTFNVERVDNGDAIENATIKLVAHGDTVQSVESDATGSVDVSDYEMAYDTVVINADGYQKVSIEDYAFGSDTTKTVQLSEGGDSDGWFGGGGSGSGSDGGIGVFHVFGFIAVIIGGGALIKRRNQQ